MGAAIQGSLELDRCVEDSAIFLYHMGGQTFFDSVRRALFPLPKIQSPSRVCGDDVNQKFYEYCNKIIAHTYVYSLALR